MPVYAVHVFDNTNTEQHVKEFTKPQEAHSYMVFYSRKLKGDFLRITVTNGQGAVLEFLTGKKP
jgi:hypothetical protein